MCKISNICAPVHMCTGAHTLEIWTVILHYSITYVTMRLIIMFFAVRDQYWLPKLIDLDRFWQQKWSWRLVFAHFSAKICPARPILRGTDFCVTTLMHAAIQVVDCVSCTEKDFICHLFTALSLLLMLWILIQHHF